MKVDPYRLKFVPDALFARQGAELAPNLCRCAEYLRFGAGTLIDRSCLKDSLHYLAAYTSRHVIHVTL